MDENIEAMTEILSEYGITASEETVKNITDDFMLHMSAMRDIDIMSTGGYKKPECDKCTELKKEIKRIEGDIDIFKENVRKRRGATAVYIEHGNVMYDMV